MAHNVRGEVRRAQLITTYGVGALVAVEDESFIVRGIDQWPVDGPNLQEPRLERALHVQGFALPPASEEGPDIPVSRFPRWYSCPSCHRLDEHKNLSSYASNICNACDVSLIPSRFVIACERGHIQDFPYMRWVHQGAPNPNQEHRLFLSTTGLTASLRSIRLECECGLDNTMEDAFSRQALVGIAKCFGQRPWLKSNDGACDSPPRTVQRGASNVWFASTKSALSIPPWSKAAFKALNQYWPVLKVVPLDALAATITGMGLAERTGYLVGDLVEAVKLRKEDAGGRTGIDRETLRLQEYEALLHGAPDTPQNPDFVCIPGELGPYGRRWFDTVMLVRRLREVRVLQSFTRLLPAGPGDDARQAPIFVDDPGWLPAIEVRGEGVFLRLDPNRLRDWEARSDVRRRAKIITERYGARFQGTGIRPDREITARLLLVHTLAHALIGQWALDSGYPAASLRERLYVGDDHAAILIYTATSDSAGSLGGVVAQAGRDLLDETLREAIDQSGWCSSDPICIESEAAGADSLNLAACHACLLLPEVSCEERNVLLDRALLIGTPNEPRIGFFASDS